MTITADTFRAELERAGLCQADLMRLTGTNRKTVWRWCHGHTDVPAYAWTILRQQNRIRELAGHLINGA